MARIHTVEETIEDNIPRGSLLNWLKDTGRVPKEWEYCSLLITQKDKACDPVVKVQRSYNKEPTP